MKRLSVGNRAGGFTLAEIIVVVVIISIITALSLPQMRSVAENNRLRASVREVMNLMKYARSEAIFNGRTTEVFLYTKDREYALDLRTPDEKTGRYDPKKPKTTMERRRTLETRVYFKGVVPLIQNIVDESKGIVAVDFYPDGTASPTLISIANEKGTEYTLEVYKSTGLVELNNGGLEQMEEKGKSLEYPLPPNYDEGYSSSGSEAAS